MNILNVYQSLTDIHHTVFFIPGSGGCVWRMQVWNPRPEVSSKVYLLPLTLPLADSQCVEKMMHCSKTWNLIMAQCCVQDSLLLHRFYYELWVRWRGAACCGVMFTLFCGAYFACFPVSLSLGLRMAAAKTTLIGLIVFQILFKD